MNRQRTTDNYDLTDERLEGSLRRRITDQEKRAEDLSRVNTRNRQTMLEAKVSLNTICRKLGIAFKMDDKLVESIPFTEVRMTRRRSNADFIDSCR